MAHTRAAIRAHAPRDVDAARAAAGLVGAGPAFAAGMAEVKVFLRQRLYRHPRVVGTTDAGKQVVRELFAVYLRAPPEMPDDFAARDDRPRAVADYIAGMTDRFAAREHLRLTGREAFAPASGV